MTDLPALGEKAKSWTFDLARKLRDRVEKQVQDGTRSVDDAVIFETGYGPSGLPHLGTFGEVARTTMVQHAFEVLTDGKYLTKLICVSDDMDGMRKVPDTVPNPEALQEHLQKPLTAVPDPFGTHESYGAHMNARLQSFLEQFGFKYWFISATDVYQTGGYDKMLVRVLEKYDDIMGVMLPTLGAERQATYSPVLPISPTTGRVLYVPMKRVNSADGTVTFEDEDGTEVTQTVTGGHAKLQWKPDFGMRWAALRVDFEMFGKDHQANAPIYSKITRILGGEPPVQYVYELFLDEKGEKISKTKGNGISIDEWLSYAPAESLALYNYTNPRKAKRLYFDIIPKTVDEYLTWLDKYPSQEPAQQLENPAWHIHAGAPPEDASPVTFALLLNLVSAANASNKDTLWGFITKYSPGTTAETHPLVDHLAGFAIRYFEDFVAPTKSYRSPLDAERSALSDLAKALNETDASDGEALQTLAFDVGKAHEFQNMRDFFRAFYEVCLGQTQGPRFGSFVALYGVDATAQLIEQALAGELTTTG